MRKIVGLTLLLFAAASAKAETDTRAKCSDNARQLLEQAWAEQPMDRSPNNTGNPAKAEYLYEQALLDSPQCKLAMNHMASLLLRDDKFRQAKEYNDLLLKYYPDDPDALQQKASLLSGAINDQQGALKIYLHLLEMNGPGNGSLYYAVARVYSKLNQLDQSIKFLTLAISINKAWGSGGNAQLDKDFRESEERQQVLDLGEAAVVPAACWPRPRWRSTPAASKRARSSISRSSRPGVYDRSDV